MKVTGFGALWVEAPHPWPFAGESPRECLISPLVVTLCWTIVRTTQESESKARFEGNLPIIHSLKGISSPYPS